MLNNAAYVTGKDTIFLYFSFNFASSFLLVYGSNSFTLFLC